MSIAPALTTDHKKILQAKFTLGQEDKFYEITKKSKNKFEYKLKDGYVAGLKDYKKKSQENSFGIENKLSMNFIVNKYIKMVKRLALSEYKRNKDKKKIKRKSNDLYEEYEDKPPQTESKISQQQPKPVMTDDNFESKLKGIIGETDIEENNENKQTDKQMQNDKSNIQPDNQQYEPSFNLVSKRRK
jgi:hypothetical protein